MSTRIARHLSLRPLQLRCEGKLVRLLNSSTAFRDQTFMIPYPYTRKDARFFLNSVHKRTVSAKKPLDWGIYKKGEGLIGLISLKKDPAISRQAEIGFWLGQDFWRQGIMTKVVQSFTQSILESAPRTQILIRCFANNEATKKIANRCGFVLQEKKYVFSKNHQKALVSSYIKRKD